MIDHGPKWTKDLGHLWLCWLSRTRESTGTRGSARGQTHGSIFWTPSISTMLPPPPPQKKRCDPTTERPLYTRRNFLNHLVEHWANELFSFSFVSCRVSNSYGILKLNTFAQFQVNWVCSACKEFLLQCRDHGFALSIQWYFIKTVKKVWS